MPVFEAASIFVDIKRGRSGDLPAGSANAARFGGHALYAVERLGKDARGRGLADAAGAGEQIGVVKASGA